MYLNIHDEKDRELKEMATSNNKSPKSNKPETPEPNQTPKSLEQNPSRSTRGSSDHEIGHHDTDPHDHEDKGSQTNRSFSFVEPPLKNRYSSFWSLALMSITACMGSAYFGFNQTMFGTLFDPFFEEIYGIRDENNTAYFGVFNAVHCIGCMLGSYYSGIILSRFGRRKSFIMMDCLAILSQLIYQIQPTSQQSPNFFFVPLYLARFLCGIFVGFNSCAVIVYLNEMIPVERSGLFIGLNPFMINLLILVSYFFYFGETPEMKGYWRVVVALPILFCLFRIASLLLIFKHETPFFLYIVKGDRDAATDSVRTIYKEEFVEEIMNDLDDEKALMGQASALKDIWQRKPVKKRIIYGCILMLFQQLVGVNAIFFYASEIFEQASGGNHKQNAFYCVLLAFFNSFFSLFVGVVIDKFGRKKPLIIGLFINTVALFGVGYAFQTGNTSIVPMLIYLYVFGYQYGLGAVAWVALCEIVPNQGAHLAVLSNWTGDLTITATSKFMRHLSESGTFFIYAGFALLAIFFVYFCIVETRGKTEVQVAVEYGEDPEKAHQHAKFAIKAKTGH